MKKCATSLVFFILILCRAVSNENEILNTLLTAFKESRIEDPSFFDSWGESEKPDEYEDLEIVKEYQYKGNYLNYKAIMFFGNDKKWAKTIVQIGTIDEKTLNLDRDALKVFYDLLLDYFGKPDLMADYGFLVNSSIRQDFDCQWNLGKYKLLFGAIDLGTIIDNKTGIAFAYLRVIRAESEDDIIPLIGLKFIAKTVKINTNGILEAVELSRVPCPTLLFIIDYNKKQVSNESFMYKAKFDSVSNSSLSFSLKENDIPRLSFEVNRYTGEYTMKFFEKEILQESLRYQGIVEKYDIFSPAF